MTSRDGGGPAAGAMGRVRAWAAGMLPGLSGLWRPAPSGPDTPGGPRRRPHLTKDQQERILREWRVLHDRLRSAAQAHLADVGDVLRGAELTFAPGEGAGAAERDCLWAMEAYQAAGKLLDEAVDLPDLAAAVVLGDRAVERLAAAHARRAGHRPPAAIVRCFYNPLHGPAEAPSVTRTAGKRRGRPARRSRPPTPRQAAADRRPACGPCRLAILSGQLPDVLPALLTVRVSRLHTARLLVPYYTVPQQDSLWSANGCGGYDDEAPARVLRGEHRRGPRP